MEINQNPFIIRRILAGILVALFLSAGFGAWYTWKTHLRLPTQSQVISSAKFSIKPLSWTPNKTIRFKVTIECFQKPELTTVDLTKITLLSDGQEDIQKPISWSPKRETPYRVSGELIFPAHDIKPTQWILSFFTEDETQFKWTL